MCEAIGNDDDDDGAKLFVEFSWELDGSVAVCLVHQ